MAPRPPSGHNAGGSGPARPRSDDQERTAAGKSVGVDEEEEQKIMTIVAILVALAALYWLGSLTYAYCANATERSRLNNQPGVLLIALFALVSLVVLLLGIYSPYGNLSVLIGGQQVRIWLVGLIGCIVFTLVGFFMRRRKAGA